MKGAPGPGWKVNLQLIPVCDIWTKFFHLWCGPSCRTRVGPVRGLHLPTRWRQLGGSTAVPVLEAAVTPRPGGLTRAALPLQVWFRVVFVFFQTNPAVLLLHRRQHWSGQPRHCQSERGRLCLLPTLPRESKQRQLKDLLNCQA